MYNFSGRHIFNLKIVTSLMKSPPHPPPLLGSFPPTPSWPPALPWASLTDIHCDFIWDILPTSSPRAVSGATGDMWALQGEVMNAEAAPAVVGAAAPMIVPSEPVSIVVDEKLMVVLNKDGGVESMELNGGMALQVSCGICNVLSYTSPSACKQSLLL